MKKTFFALIAFSLALPSLVSAHVSIQPSTSEPGYQKAIVRVPNEKDVATTEVRVVVPENVDVHGVMAIPGWTHTEKHEVVTDSVIESEEEHQESEGRVSEVTWSGGEIGVGEFVEFALSVAYPDETSEVVWNAYQTYSDGEVVKWDGSDKDHPAPKVSLTTQVTPTNPSSDKPSSTSQYFSIGAVVLSFAALLLSLRKNNSSS